MPDNMALIIVISTGDFQMHWNLLSLKEKVENGLLGYISDSYHNSLMNNNCIQHSR